MSPMRKIPDHPKCSIRKRITAVLDFHRQTQTHLAESVMVISDTSMRRQFSTLSSTGLLTCVQLTEENSYSPAKRIKK